MLSFGICKQKVKDMAWVAAGCLIVFGTILTVSGLVPSDDIRETSEAEEIADENVLVTEGTDSVICGAVTTACDNWGLGFHENGKAPTGNKSQEELKKYNGFYLGKTGDEEGEKTIYLTFDAGYENGYTEKILDCLKEEEVPAAFFLVGNYIEENPEIVKRMEAEGHIVGNHTMHHPDMSSIADSEAFKKELSDLESVYKKVTGKDMKKFYRPPQGKFNQKNLEQACEMGYKTVFWSLAYVDWIENKQPTREEAMNKLNSRIHPGAIVLLHSTSKTNNQILKELIEGWKEKGYVFKTIEDL